MCRMLEDGPLDVHPLLSDICGGRVVRREALATTVEREMSTGTQLPREQDLATRFGVSRNTLREALLHLESTGVLVRRWGIGTFVAHRRFPVGITMDQNTPIRDMLRASGYEASICYFAVTTVPSAGGTSADLTVTDDTPIWRIDRIFDAGGTPAVYLQDYLPSIINGFEFDPEPLRDVNIDVISYLAETVNCHVTRMDVELEASTVDADTALKMGLDIGSPVIHATQVAYARNGAIVIASDVIYRTDIARIRINRVARSNR